MIYSPNKCKKHIKIEIKSILWCLSYGARTETVKMLKYVTIIIIGLFLNWLWDEKNFLNVWSQEISCADYYRFYKFLAFLSNLPCIQTAECTNKIELLNKYLLFYLLLPIVVYQIFFLFCKFDIHHSLLLLLYIFRVYRTFLLLIISQILNQIDAITITTTKKK